MREDSHCAVSFGRVFVIKDSSPLMRKEEKRLREEMACAKQNFSPDSKIYIRSGKLYCNHEVIGQINVANQLF